MLVVALAATTFGVYSQDYKLEAGVGAGISGYLGDINQSNVLRRPGYAAEVSIKYLINKRFAAKAAISTAKISGNSEDFDMVFPDGATYKFGHPYYDVSAAFEFNFFNFGIGAAYAPEAKAFSPMIPIGVGAKYKLKSRINLGVEMRAKMMLGDKIDGLTDLRGMNSSFMKNTDWCPTLMFSISYEFKEVCKTCHYVE